VWATPSSRGDNSQALGFLAVHALASDLYLISCDKTVAHGRNESGAVRSRRFIEMRRIAQESDCFAAYPKHPLSNA
jgi:hypothetical protein